jgi:hypothetical protein
VDDNSKSFLSSWIIDVGAAMPTGKWPTPGLVYVDSVWGQSGTADFGRSLNMQTLDKQIQMISGSE